MVKIASVEAENVKRVKAVYLEPRAEGLTVIGGRNGQGKTSLLDAIGWALGGDKLRPSNAAREGAASAPSLRVVLDNGIVVERRGKNGSLKVTDPSGRKSGQALLSSLVDRLALDLPRFMESSDKDKAETLLSILGVGDRLAELDAKASSVYNQRHDVGVMERQKRASAEEMQFWPDAPAEEVDAAELIVAQSAILARNGENQRKRNEASAIQARLAAARSQLAALEQQEAQIRQAVDAKAAEVDALAGDAATASKDVAQLAAADAVNEKVRTNARRARAMAEADELKSQYDDLDAEMDRIRAERTDLLRGADLPLPGLSVDEEARLTYGGQPWDCMSGSEQLKVATAIVRRLKPECGFVLVDKLEQMDLQTLAEFGAWAESEGLQVIGTRVSTGGECSLVIEDGRGQLGEPDGADKAEAPAPAAPAGWEIR